MEYRQAEVEWGGFLDLAPAGLPHMRFIKRISRAGHMGYLLNKADRMSTGLKFHKLDRYLMLTLQVQ